MCARPIGLAIPRLRNCPRLPRARRRPIPVDSRCRNASREAHTQQIRFSGHKGVFPSYPCTVHPSTRVPHYNCVHHSSIVCPEAPPWRFTAIVPRMEFKVKEGCGAWCVLGTTFECARVGMSCVDADTQQFRKNVATSPLDKLGVTRARVHHVVAPRSQSAARLQAHRGPHPRVF